MDKSLDKLLLDKEYIISELECRFHEENTIPQNIRQTISEIKQCDNYDEFTDILNNLLITANHRSHQYVTLLLQHIKSPTSIPYIKQVLDSNFTFLEYTYSESNVIAKWFSWALASIGTEEAINLIKEYAESENNGISEEMKYRLNRINN